MNLKPLNHYLGFLKLIVITILVIALIVTIEFNFNSYVFIALFALIGVVLSLLPLSFEKFPIAIRTCYLKKSHHIILNILFFILITGTLLSLLLEVYSKSWLFYLLISFCTLLLGIEIMLNSKNSHHRLILAKIYILCIVVFLSNQIVYPLGIGGSDSSLHFTTISNILQKGYISSNDVYSFTPLHHVLITISSLISSLDFKILYFTLGPLWMSLNLPFIFLIGKKLVNKEFGLIASLIYPFNDYLLFWSTHSAQLTYVLPFAFMAFSILLFRIYSPKMSYSIVLLILITAIIFSHHYSSVIFIIILLSFIIGNQLFHLENGEKKARISILFLLFFVGLFAHWMYYSNLIIEFSKIFDAYLNALSLDFITHQSSFSQGTRYDNLPLSIIFINTFSTNILIMLSSYGFFMFVRKGGLFRNIILSWMSIIPFLIILGVFIDLKFLLPNRLYALMQLFGLIFLASETLLTIKNGAVKSRVLLIIYVLILLLLPFFSASSTIAGFETSLFVGEQPYVKLYNTPQEKYSKTWIENKMPQDLILYPSGSIYPNSLYGSYLENSLHTKEKLDYSSEGSLLLSNISNNSIILFSKFDILTGFGYEPTGSYSMGSGIVLRSNNKEYDSLNTFIEMDKMYSNEIISVYHKNR